MHVNPYTYTTLCLRNLANASAHLHLQRSITFIFFSVCLACAAFHAPLASADNNVSTNVSTNVSDVQIEVIDQPASGDLVTDPIQAYIATTNLDEDGQVDLWGRIKDGYGIPDVESTYATKQETWYASRPDYIKRMVDRSQRYLFHIVEEVQKRNMPTEIALLPMIESAFNPQANSTSKASGIWQFIPSTGKSFGLKQNWWVDNRRDVTAATNAALDYLQKLHGMFGTWDLALAAYNAGEGTVQRAIDKNRRQGLPTDYQNLSLPEETRNYVPKLQAIKNIVTDPEKFGLKLSSIPNRPYFARVTTPKQIDSKLAAQLAEISYDEFISLNPSYNRPVITSQGEKTQLLLPVWAAERFADNLANYDKPLTSWQTYNAKRGERMDNIASKFGINVSQLRNVNGLAATGKLRNSQAMLVPAVYSGKPLSNSDEIRSDSINSAEMENNNHIDQTAEIEPVVSRPVIQKVKNGDTLDGLASKYGTSAKNLMQINHLKSAKLKAGQSLKINEVAVTRGKFVKVSYNTHNFKSNNPIKSRVSKIASRHKTDNKISSNKSRASKHISAKAHHRLK
ncbi:MAG: transglycosylase SLT domain-containing protein [Bdellovibrio sp.]|nr:transglycosylase SLT domain-containing protein [Methylotenera sp.]